MTTDKLREQMWDYVYGLLSPEEGEALVTRIKSEPQAARLYAEVRLQADLVGYASRIDDPALVLEAPGAAAKLTPAQVQRRVPAAEGAFASARGLRRGGNWLAGSLATALALLLAVGHFWPRVNERQLAAQFIVTKVEAPSTITAGLTSTLTFQTARLGIDGETSTGVPAAVELTLRDRAGATLLQRQVTTDNAGRGTLEVPGSVLEPDIRLEVVPAKERPTVLAEKELAEKKLGESATSRQGGGVDAASMALSLPVQPEPEMTYFLLEEPAPQTGQATKFAAWNFSSFSIKPAADDKSREALAALPGIAVAESKKDADREFNVVTGVLKPAPSATPPAGALAYGFGAESKARFLEPSTVNQRGAGAVAPERAAAAGVRAQTAQNELRAGANKAVPPATFKEQTAKEQMAKEQMAKEQMAKEQPLDLKREADVPALASRAEGQSLGGAAPLPVIPANQRQVTVEVPSEMIGKPLIAALASRGVTFANVPVAAEPPAVTAGESAKQLGKVVTVDLPPEVDGRIDVALLDRSNHPPELILKDSLYREPARKLQIELSNLKERFAPGERVKLLLQVNDETGQPAAAALIGVRIWSEALITQTGQPPETLAEVAFDTTTAQVISTGQASQLALADQQLRDLGRSAAPSFALGDVLSTTNQPAIQARYEAILAAAMRRRQSAVETIGMIVIAGGLLLALVLGVLAARQMLGNLQVTIPALMVVTASLLVGLAWVGWLPSKGTQQIAMTLEQQSGNQTRTVRSLADEAGAPLAAASPPPATPAEPPAKPALDFADDRRAKATESLNRPAAAAPGSLAGGGGAKGPGADAVGGRRLADAAEKPAAAQPPASLYFNPHLLTDAQGQATIEFDMPQVDSDYRLLIDALGHGRIGSRQQLIIGRAADAK